jgi:hypothetical protein
MVRPEQRVQYRADEKRVDLIFACFRGDMIEAVILAAEYIQNEVIDPILIPTKTLIRLRVNIRQISGFVPCNINKFKGCLVCRLVIGSHFVQSFDITLVALFLLELRDC